MYRYLIQNHVLANILFLLVIVMGSLAYYSMPREQEPAVNFNWIDITTLYPGAAAPDVEKQVTNIIEDAIRKVSDIKFVSSNSRSGISNILVRFEEIETGVFDKRVADLRREIEGIEDELPEGAIDSLISEITTDNAFPTATVVVSAPSDDENLRRQANRVRQDLAQLDGVASVYRFGLSDPEIHIVFDPERLERYGISPVDLAQTIRVYFRNLSAGKINIASSSWAVRIRGTRYDLDYLGHIPIVTAQGEIPLKEVAEVIQAKEPARQLVRYNRQPAVKLAITKKEKQNILELVERIGDFIDRNAETYRRSGIQVDLVDDQTQITRNALRIMKNNAVIGLSMVLCVTWLFLGARIAVLTGIAIPFILCGTFWFLQGAGQTLNVSILLGIVISLGMLVDDAVVVVEAIYYRLQRGMETLDATLEGLREVVVPVTTSVLTTIAAFLPLMLMPGLLGQFMMVIPMVVTCALLVSLIEAYWLLPVHILFLRVRFSRASRSHRARERIHRLLRKLFVRLLIRVLRHPVLSTAVLVLMFAGSAGAVLTDRIKLDFFASDPIPLFYINVKMPAGTELNSTLEKVQLVEDSARRSISQEEVRSVVSYAGHMRTHDKLLFGDQYGQILVSLNPRNADNGSVGRIIASVEREISRVPGIDEVSFLRLAGGPPATRDVSVKVRSDDLEELVAATRMIQDFMEGRPEFMDTSNDNLPGQYSLDLSINSAAVQRTGVSPDLITRTIRLLVDGEIVSEFRHQGEKIDIRLKAEDRLAHIHDLLDYHIPAKAGQIVPLRELVNPSFGTGANSINHFNYRRTITIESDIDKSLTDTVKANQLIQEFWQTLQPRYPNTDLDFSGIVDDIEESLDAIGALFLFGLCLIYLILGTQFRSYFQPLLVILTVPMAATGVVIGLLISRYPLSLYTLYGIVALAGIAVNATIMIISTANTNLRNGMPVTHAIVYAARRRVVPIIITTITTIAGLFSLATGLGGHSLLWGPVASSMVWGVGLSSVLTLFFIPLFYRVCMRPWH